MPRPTEDIIREISRRREEILKNLDLVHTYVRLKEMYRKNKIQSPEFRSLFKEYYRLNQARLSQEWQNHFFALLSKGKMDLACVLCKLYDTLSGNNRHKVYFSFATKLIHTIDNNKPIYDSRVGKVIKKRVNGNGPDERIKSCVKIYKDLKGLYPKLLKNREIKKAISNFRKIYKVNRNAVGDVKVLDFIMWSLGDIELNEKIFS